VLWLSCHLASPSVSGTFGKGPQSDKLLTRAREIAEELAKLPSLTTKYTRIAMIQKLRRIIDEGVTLGLALEGISAADVAPARTK
jgi:hypothetical protein